MLEDTPVAMRSVYTRKHLLGRVTQTYLSIRVEIRFFVGFRLGLDLRVLDDYLSGNQTRKSTYLVSLEKMCLDTFTKLKFHDSLKYCSITGSGYNSTLPRRYITSTRTACGLYGILDTHNSANT